MKELSSKLAAVQSLPDYTSASNVVSVDSTRTSLEKEKMRIIHYITVRNNAEERIDLDTIRVIHRSFGQDDGYVAFAATLCCSFQDLAGIRISELDNKMPNVCDYLFEDGRFTLNAGFCASRKLSLITSLPLPQRKESKLRYLNACYLDIDYYKVFPYAAFHEVLHIVLLAVQDKIIPQPSFICHSGRGMYLIWLLKSPYSNQPVGAFKDAIEAYKKTNRALAMRLNNFRSMGIDYGACDAARYLRVPGSRHSTSGKIVVYCPLFRQNGKIPAYTLEELNTFQGKMKKEAAPLKRKHLPARKADKKSNPNKAKGYRAVGEYIVEDFLKIEKFQGGFKQGIRRQTLTILAVSGRRAGYSRYKIKTLLKDVAARCHPPYPSSSQDSSLANILNQAWSEEKINYKSEILAANYFITAELAEQLQLKTISPAAKQKPLSQRKENELIRRSSIKELMVANDPPPSIREIQQHLENEGIRASISTIHNDVTQITHYSERKLALENIY